MKQALIICEDFAAQNCYNYNVVGNIHDEFQAQVIQKDAHKFGRLAVSSIAAAGEHFNMRCPLAGKYKIGNNWAATH